MKKYDAIVLGAGPAGICAALYLVRAGYKTALLEKNTPGGQVLLTAEVENYLGFPKGVKGYELTDLFSAHLDEYEVDRLRAEVVSMEESQENGVTMHTLHMAEGAESLIAPVVIVATGAQNRPLGIKEEDDYRGKGVSYCALCDGNFYRNLDVAIVGGGNSALEEALYLSRIVNKVYLIHRREGFRGAKVYLDKIHSMPEKIELVTSHVVDSLHGNPNLETIRVKHVESGETRDIAAEGLFIYVGNLPNSGFLPKSIPTNSHGFIITDAEMRTEVKGIFAAGDIRDKACRQVSSAVGDGATAATAAITYLEHIDV